MPTYSYTCAPCAYTTDVILVPFIERDHVSCSCGLKMERIWNGMPHMHGDLKTYVDVADPSGAFPVRHGGWAEHRELVKRRADQGIVWNPGR